MTADLRTTLRAILFQLMKPSRPEVGEKKIMVQEGGRSYYDHVIPNIIAFVLHHWMEKGIFVKVLLAWWLFYFGYQTPLPGNKFHVSWPIYMKVEGTDTVCLHLLTMATKSTRAYLILQTKL